MSEGKDRGPGTGDGQARSAIAVVGNRETVVAFRAAGLAVFPLDTGTGAADRVEEIISQGYRVIFFTEELLPELAPVLERYRREAVPCLVALPQGQTSAGLVRLRELVRRAVGSDVFAGNQEQQ